MRKKLTASASRKALKPAEKARFEAASANLQRMLQEVARFSRKPEPKPLREPEVWRADQAVCRVFGVSAEVSAGPGPAPKSPVKAAIEKVKEAGQ